MKITQNSVPSIAYSLFVDGNLVDQATQEKPLVYLAGVGGMIPGFEKKMEGLQSGDKFAFKLSSEEAYGEPNDEYVVDLSTDAFKVDGVINTEAVGVGKVVQMQDENGYPLRGIVLAMDDEKVKMDFNHPLAGKELNFEGEIVSVREAEKEELDHGHVHGEGGHQH